MEDWLAEECRLILYEDVGNKWGDSGLKVEQSKCSNKTMADFAQIVNTMKPRTAHHPSTASVLLKKLQVCSIS